MFLVEVTKVKVTFFFCEGYLGQADVWRKIFEHDTARGNIYVFKYLSTFPSYELCILAVKMLQARLE